jgi:hypothetical protein
MGDPTDGPPYNEQPKPGHVRQSQSDRSRCNGKIDIKTAPGQAEASLGGSFDKRSYFGPGLREYSEDDSGAWVAIGVEGMTEPWQPVAACQATSHYGHGVLAIEKFAK